MPGNAATRWPARSRFVHETPKGER
jgi:hypothetical protein